MAKERLVESRFDFRGGRNTYVSPDLLNDNELIDSTNARLMTDGLITKRTGSRRLHASALAAAPIKGITQWDGPSGLQIVAICNGDLFYRNIGSGEFAAFTQVDPGATDAFSTSSPALFTTLRGNADSAPLKLYIASGGKLYEWDGTTLNRLDGASSAVGQFAPDASLIASYHLRIFTNSVVRPQHLVWSKLADGRVYTAGLPGDGGTAMVSAIQNEEIVALQPLGRSLLVATNNSIARLAGYSAADIQIDQDMEGISPDIGVVGPLALHRAERVVFFVSDLGPYLASEGSVSPVGLKVKPDFDAMDRTLLDQIVVGHNHGKHEIFIAYAGSGDSGLNKSAIIYNLQHQAWYGPFTYTFGITCASHYEDANGDEFLIAGCSDGFVRHMDIGSKDDVLSDASGGSIYTMTVEFPPMFFGHPGVLKVLKRIWLRTRVIDTPSTGSVSLSITTDAMTNTYPITAFAGPLATQKIYPSPNDRGGWFKFKIIDNSDKISQATGLVVEAYNMQRPHGSSLDPTP